MLKDFIYKSSSDFPILSTTINNVCDYKKYLRSIFNTDDCKYFTENTKLEFRTIVKGGSNKVSGLLRYNNIDEIQQVHYNKFNGETCLYFPEGFDVIELEMPYAKIRFRNWTKFIKAIGLYIFYLNQQIKDQDLFEYLLHIFDTYVKIPNNNNFIQNRLAKIKGNINECISYHSLYIVEVNRKLKLIVIQIMNEVRRGISINPNVKKNILFNPDYDLSTNERRRESILAIHKFRKENETKKKYKIEVLKEIINNWDFDNDKRITQEKVCEKSDWSIATIKRHWVFIKEDILLFNNNFNKAS